MASHADQWHLNFDDAMNDAQIDELDVVIRLPQELEFRTDFYNSRTYDDLDKVTLEVSEDGRLLHLYSTAGLSGDDRVSVEIDIPRGAQQRMAGGQTGFWTMFGVGTLLAAGLFWLMNRHSKRRTVGELPNGINPLQAALLTGKPGQRKNAGFRDCQLGGPRLYRDTKGGTNNPADAQAFADSPAGVGKTIPAFAVGAG